MIRCPNFELSPLQYTPSPRVRLLAIKTTGEKIRVEVVVVPVVEGAVKELEKVDNVDAESPVTSLH